VAETTATSRRLKTVQVIIVVIIVQVIIVVIIVVDRDTGFNSDRVCLSSFIFSSLKILSFFEVDDRTVHRGFI